MRESFVNHYFNVKTVNNQIYDCKTLQKRLVMDHSQ